MTGELEAVVLRCADIEATRTFYESLGIEVTEERHGTGPKHYSARLGGGVVEFYPATERFPAASVLIVVQSDGGGPANRLTDPDGRVVMVSERT